MYNAYYVLQYMEYTVCAPYRIYVYEDDEEWPTFIEYAI